VPYLVPNKHLHFRGQQVPLAHGRSSKPLRWYADSSKIWLRFGRTFKEEAMLFLIYVNVPQITYSWTVPRILDHSYLVLKSTRSKIADTSVRILEVLKLLFQQFLILSSFQRDMSGPVLRALSNNR
jgi:hypothetical protein